MSDPHAPEDQPMSHDDHAVSDPKLGGRWDMSRAQFAGAATHVALLHTNKILALGGSSQDPQAVKNPPPAELLDLSTFSVTQTDCRPIHCDLFCGGHTLLEDGTFLMVGGTARYLDWLIPIFYRFGDMYFPTGLKKTYLFEGVKEAYVFDPVSETWRSLPPMRIGRWYPTLIRLADNSVLSIAGLIDRFPWWIWLRTQEVYRSGRGWSEMKQKKWFPLYPRLHLLPDGNVFYSGVFNLHFEFPSVFPSARYDCRTEHWTNVGGRHVEEQREEGISLLLPLRPRDKYAARILIAGGGHYLRKTAVDEVEMIDLSRDNPRWESKARMCCSRIHANGVLLPDGKVLVVGGNTGMTGHDTGMPIPVHDPDAVHTSEMYDPETNLWAPMAKQARDRVYHSTALLLPDGRVISMGSNPKAKAIEHSIEIYSPPYLFRGDRPVITSAPERLRHGQPFTLNVDQARQISQVVLMRPEVVTHVTNTDQRLLELEFKVVSHDTLEVQGPVNTAHMPQGYAMLFVLNQDGVPAVSRFVKVG